MTVEDDNDTSGGQCSSPSPALLEGRGGGLEGEGAVGGGGGGGGGNPLPLEASREDLLQCQFSSWFPTFRHLQPDDDRGDEKRTNVTIKSKIITNLPHEFIDFLQADGIRLPEGATKLSSCAPNEVPVPATGTRQVAAATDDDEDDEYGGGYDDEKENEEAQISHQFSFLQLNQQITEAIENLGGSVIPKLNWSAPKDATWVNEGTLKCKTPGDIYLLLKSSDFCVHDLMQQQLRQQEAQSQAQSEPLTSTTTAAIESSSNDTATSNLVNPPSDTDTATTTIYPRLELVLRKWCNFYPSMEFRCFVRNHILIGMSQRNHSQHYPHLLLDRLRIRAFILEFFEDVICHRFANDKVPNYVFDVYVDKSDRVWLVDYNVWCIQTDSLLFTWEELVDMQVPLLLGDNDDHDDDNGWPELRVVETALEVRHDPLSSYRAPMDTVALAASSSATASPYPNNQQQQQPAAGTGVTSFESFMAMCQKPSERNDSSSDDEE